MMKFDILTVWNNQKYKFKLSDDENKVTTILNDEKKKFNNNERPHRRQTIKLWNF